MATAPFLPYVALVATLFLPSRGPPSTEFHFLIFTNTEYKFLETKSWVLGFKGPDLKTVALVTLSNNKNPEPQILLM